MTTESAKELIEVMKELLISGTYYLPCIGSSNEIPLQSLKTKSDRFKVVVNRTSKIIPSKYTLLLRYPQEDLLRIDVNGPQHVNPDRTVVPCPHIHMRLKDAGKWDAWAYDIPAVFGNTDDIVNTLKRFLEFCQTNQISKISICEQMELF